MAEQREPPSGPELERPEEMIDDLEPDERETDSVRGGAPTPAAPTPKPLSLDGIKGESQDSRPQNSIEVI